jgi:hypothetical protein
VTQGAGTEGSKAVPRVAVERRSRLDSSATRLAIPADPSERPLAPKEGADMTKKQTKKAGKARKTPKQRTPARAEKASRAPRERDPRIPAAGTVIVRPYKGKDVRVTVLEEGFRCDGKEYRSLSKLASEITGNSTNGLLWFRLTERPTPAKDTTPKTPAPKRKGKPATLSAATEPAPAAESATA